MERGSSGSSTDFFVGLTARDYIYPTFILGSSPKFHTRQYTILSHFYEISATEYYDARYVGELALKLDQPSHISVLDNKNFLLIGRAGKMYHLSLKKEGDFSPEESLHYKKLSATFPTSEKEFRLSDESKGVNTNWVRVNDIYVESENESGNQRSVYVSHNFWNAEKQCFTLRLVKLVGDVSILLSSSYAPQWQVLYETTPCFAIANPHVHPYTGQAGGRIVGVDEENLLFSVGDFGFDTQENVGEEGGFPQDANSSYGKIFKINRYTGEYSLISKGHRNPQGLYQTPDGTIWETEHGPKGGDELNKIELGGNYGWPNVTYGTAYEGWIWPPAEYQDYHEGYDHPVFVWVPSIGISSMIGIEGDLFPLWKNDLLIGSLRDKSLFRVQVNNNRVVYSEPIKIGEKVRDLRQTPNGEIFMWTDQRNLIRLSAKESLPKKNQPIAVVGEQLFNQKCASCHSITPRASHKIGPNLHKVYKSRIARHDDYSYSSALRLNLRRQWTRENLGLFLKDSQAFTPGTSMQFKVPDDEERRALLHYLEKH